MKCFGFLFFYLFLFYSILLGSPLDFVFSVFSFFLLFFSLSRSSFIPAFGRPGGLFAFPQDDVDDAADGGQREGHPCQDVGESEAGRVLMPIRVPHGEDGGSDDYAQR